MAVDVTDATFETEVMVRSHQVPVIVDLWAPWCGPCKTLGPILEKATDATMGQVVLAKVNVDENPQISQAFQVQSIPAVFIMKDGKVLDSFVGAQPEHVVLQIVQSLLPDPSPKLHIKLQPNQRPRQLSPSVRQWPQLQNLYPSPTPSK